MKIKYENNPTLGLALGMAVAVSISWSIHKSVLWASLHGFLSWIYVLYYVITS